MKRIAICISGSLRSIDYCYENFLEKIIKPNIDNYEIKLFYYIPEDNNCRKILYINKIVKLNPEILIVKDKKITLPNLIWKGRPEENKIDTNSTAGIIGYLYQLEGIQKSFEMLVKYEKSNNIIFDKILRIRSDVIFKDKIIFDNYESEKITVPSFHSFNGINDRFAIGNRNNMKIYMKMFDNIYIISNRYYKETNKKLPLINAEYFCKLNLDYYNIEYCCNNDIKFCRIRDNGEILNDV